MDDNIIDAVIKYLETKLNLNELEKDIVDTYRELTKQPIDRNGLIKKIKDNKAKQGFVMQEKILANIQTNYTSKIVPLENLTDDELSANLWNQLLLLCSKYYLGDVNNDH
ncbi:MAG: hypothetical protein IKA72_00465 [Clostridia bacterium]|nr:hypothetical protein [Clostridia bacterium]